VDSTLVHGNDTYCQRQIFFSFSHFFFRPHEASLIQLTVKVIGVGAFRVGEHGTAAITQVAGKEGDQCRKRWSVVEDLRAKDERKPLIERRLW
jgi:hypothetical protein